MEAKVKDYTCTPVYKSIKDILEDESINYEFKPEKKTFLGELQKSMMIELLISQMRPNISVFFLSTNNGKYIPSSLNNTVFSYEFVDALIFWNIFLSIDFIFPILLHIFFKTNKKRSN